MLNSFYFKNGSEGPHHDPYGYHEITFTNIKGESMTLHEGLAAYIESGNIRLNVYDLPFNMVTEDKEAYQMLWNIFTAFCKVDEKYIGRLENKYFEAYYSDPMGYPEMYA